MVDDTSDSQLANRFISHAKDTQVESKGDKVRMALL